MHVIYRVFKILLIIAESCSNDCSFRKFITLNPPTHHSNFRVGNFLKCVILIDYYNEKNIMVYKPVSHIFIGKAIHVHCIETDWNKFKLLSSWANKDCYILPKEAGWSTNSPSILPSTFCHKLVDLHMTFWTLLLFFVILSC